MIKRNSRIIKRNPRIIKRGLFMGGIVNFPVKNLGGYLPNPPDDCERKDMWRNFANVIWIDLSVCHFCSKEKACQTRLLYLQEIKKVGIRTTNDSK